VKKYPLAEGLARINLGVQNLFDSRTVVTTTAGDAAAELPARLPRPPRAGRHPPDSFRKMLF
jgi:hypothetical protein